MLFGANCAALGIIVNRLLLLRLLTANQSDRCADGPGPTTALKNLIQKVLGHIIVVVKTVHVLVFAIIFLRVGSGAQAELEHVSAVALPDPHFDVSALSLP